MDVTQRIIDCARERAAGIVVEDFCIGVGYTGIKLSDGSGGMDPSPASIKLFERI